MGFCPGEKRKPGILSSDLRHSLVTNETGLRELEALE